MFFQSLSIMQVTTNALKTTTYGFYSDWWWSNLLHKKLINATWDFMEVEVISFVGAEEALEFLMTLKDSTQVKNQLFFWTLICPGLTDGTS